MGRQKWWRVPQDGQSTCFRMAGMGISFSISHSHIASYPQLPSPQKTCHPPETICAWAGAAHHDPVEAGLGVRRHAKHVALGRRQILRTVGYATQPGNARPAWVWMIATMKPG